MVRRTRKPGGRQSEVNLSPPWGYESNSLRPLPNSRSASFSLEEALAKSEGIEVSPQVHKLLMDAYGMAKSEGAEITPRTWRKVAESLAEAELYRPPAPETIDADDNEDAESERHFVSARSALHEVYIREYERTRRLGFVLAALLLAIAGVVPLFAPADRQTASIAVSLGILVFAAGAVGYTGLRLKTKQFDLNASKSDKAH